VGWLYFFLTIGAAFLLYWVRHRCRILYGAVEILVGVLIMALVCMPPRPILLDVGDHSRPSGSLHCQICRRIFRRVRLRSRAGQHRRCEVVEADGSMARVISVARCTGERLGRSVDHRNAIVGGS
jgi:hypothetical protein